MGVPHAQLDGNVRGHDIRQVGDVAGTRCTHLEDEVARRLICQEHRQRQADLIVERELGGHRRPVLAHDLEQQVLRRRLTHRSRHRDDIEVSPTAQLLHVRPRQSTERLGRIIDDNLSHGLVDLVFDDHSDGTARHRPCNERMPVGGLATARNVERPLGCFARVGDHRACHEHIGANQATRHCLSNPLC